MSYIYWNDDYRIGVEELDEQHKSLFDLMNRLQKSFDYEEAHKEFFKNLNALVKYAEKHFTSEENYMKKIGYPDLKSHQRKHEQLSMDIFKFASAEVKNNHDAMGLIKFLKDWLCIHIKHEDMLFRNFNDEKTRQN